MATFDFSKAAAIITSSPTPIYDVLNIQFGVPECALNFTKDLLGAFPSPVLNGMKDGIQEGKALADSIFKDIMRRVFLDTGIVEYDTTLGRFVFVSSSSNLGVEQDMLGGLNNLHGLGTILGFGAQAWLIGDSIGAQIDEIKNCIDQMKAFAGLQKGPSALASKFANFQGVDSNGDPVSFIAPPPATVAASQVFDSNKETLEQAAGFTAKADAQIQNINEITQARLSDPENNPEPVFWANMENEDPASPWFGQTLEGALSGETSFALVDAVSGPNGPILPPELATSGFNPFVDVLNSSGMEAPLSVKGQFLFSKTGIYYDSYGGGIDLPQVSSLVWTLPNGDTVPAVDLNGDGIDDYGFPVDAQGNQLLDDRGFPVWGAVLSTTWSPACITDIVNAIYFDDDGKPIPGTGVPADMFKWLYKYNPNIGGKGEIVTWSTFNEWAGTVFDMAYIDESSEMQDYYEMDQFLQVILDQRNREIYDLSGYIGELQKSGYTEDSALLSNQRQVLLSKISDHDSKIKRRKKQIQAHVVLAPSGTVYQSILVTSGIPIPINSFEGLADHKIAIEQSTQENLLFNPGEVSGAVLPLCPTFIKSDIPQDAFTVEEIMVPPVGMGSIITSDRGVSGVKGTLLSLNDRISTDGLVSIYNFLDTDMVQPDSTSYFAINGATTATMDRPAQLCGSSINSMFPSGVGLPYFRGVCNFFSGIQGDGNPKAKAYAANDEYLYSPYRPYGYARLEGGWTDVDSLLYNVSGSTFEFWTHLPDLWDATGLGWNSDNYLSSLHRVVLGCENRGGSYSSTDEYWIAGPQGNTSVKGALMGFTRDCRVTKGSIPSNDPAHNSIGDGIYFHLTPTQSINVSGVTLLAASSDPAYCVQDEVGPSGYYGIAVSVDTSNSSGKKIGDCSSGFVLTTVTIDYAQDEVSIYLNGELLKRQSVTKTFGVNRPPQIPSMVTASSFFYDNEFEGILPPNANPAFPDNSLGAVDFWSWDGPVPAGNGGSLLTPWIIGGGYTDGMYPNELGADFYTPGSNDGMNFMGGTWGGKKSGLNGFIGSFKLYKRAIREAEALQNYNAQKGFFEHIRTYPY